MNKSCPKWRLLSYISKHLVFQILRPQKSPDYLNQKSKNWKNYLNKANQKS